MKIMLILSALMVTAAAWGGGLEENPAGGGIIFYQTCMLEKLHEFYIKRIGCELWLDQGGCRIYRYGNLLFGFCQGERAELEGMITFFYENKETVDRLFPRFKDFATTRPQETKKYRIYHFFARDPEGRAMEFQTFLHPIKWKFGAGK